MRLSGNSISVNLFVTIMVIIMIFAMPALDRYECRKRNINYHEAYSTNKNTDRILALRQVILIIVFSVYVMEVLYLTLFSRNAADDYRVHAELFKDFASSFHIDLGFLDFFRVLFREGFSAAVSHVRIDAYYNITQVYMNIALFVPMGYLLPYIFKWFREKVTIRPVTACFLISFAIENIQLITRRGFYDVDDLVTNTLGGLIGQMMFIAVAYVLTHPDWKKEVQRYRRWRKNAKKSALFPFMKKMTVSRTTIYASDETAVFDFYVAKLGFRMRRQLVPEDSVSTSFLLEVGSEQVEIICLNEEKTFPEQHLTFSCRNLNRVRKRLQKMGIDEGDYEKDIYTDVRTLKFSAPDNVTITLLEH
ncbi:MAG: VanZ family protein [Solobacterium sp.]|nr:VanZ family protein [Solobacterium sp.]